MLDLNIMTLTILGRMDSHYLTTARQSFSYLYSGSWERLQFSPLTKADWGKEERKETFALKQSLTPFSAKCLIYSQQKEK